LLPLIEVDARPLVEALVSEVNLLLHRVRRTSRHNHMLLTRAVDMHQETLELLRKIMKRDGAHYEGECQSVIQTGFGCKGKSSVILLP